MRLFAKSTITKRRFSRTPTTRPESKLAGRAAELFVEDTAEEFAFRGVAPLGVMVVDVRKFSSFELLHAVALTINRIVANK
jgi:hypothetical protein